MTNDIAQYAGTPGALELTGAESNIIAGESRLTELVRTELTMAIQLNRGLSAGSDIARAISLCFITKKIDMGAGKQDTYIWQQILVKQPEIFQRALDWMANGYKPGIHFEALGPYKSTKDGVTSYSFAAMPLKGMYLLHIARSAKAGKWAYSFEDMDDSPQDVEVNGVRDRKYSGKLVIIGRGPASADGTPCREEFPRTVYKSNVQNPDNPLWNTKEHDMMHKAWMKRVTDDSCPLDLAIDEEPQGYYAGFPDYPALESRPTVTLHGLDEGEDEEGQE